MAESTPAEFEECIKILKKRKENVNLSTLSTIQKALCSSSEPQVQVNDQDFVRLLLALFRHKNHKIRFESVLSIMHIISRSEDQLEEVVKSGGVELIGQLLSPDLPVDFLHNLLWILATIVKNSSQERDFVLRALPNLLHTLGRILQQHQQTDLKRTATCMLASFCHHSSPEDFQFRILVLLSRFYNDEDSVVLANVWLALKALAEGTNDRIQNVLETGCVRQLVNSLSQDNETFIPALQCLGNLVTGTDAQTEVVLDAGFIDEALNLCRRPQTQASELITCCWALGNIFAGPPNQVQMLIDSGVLPLFHQLIGSEDPDLPKEILMGLTNAPDQGTLDQLETIFVKNDFRFLGFILPFLEDHDGNAIESTLNSLINLLKSAQNLPFPHCFTTELLSYQYPLQKQVENLTKHPDPVLRGRAEELLKLVEEAFADVTFVKPAKR